MSALFSSPATPPPPAPPPPAPAIDAAVQQQAMDADRQKRIELAQGGRASTILTGGLGDTSTPQTARHVLLGN